MELDPIVQVAFVSGGFGLLSLIVSELRLRKQAGQIGEISEQVKNSHETNLRDDVDRVLSGVETLVEAQRRQGQDITGIREDVRMERTERVALSDRLDDHIRST